jgi:hypothetical protein
MADLIPTERASERGQLLLIAAFIIATSFVVLALVVNSAIFTENLATRDDVAGSQDALQHRHGIEQSIGAVVEEINEDSSLGNSDAKDQVEALSRQGGLQQSRRGRVVEVEYGSIDNGIKIAQDKVGNFSNADAGAADWVVIEEVDRTRNFRINLTDYGELTNPSNAFKLVVNGTNDRLWNLTIANETGSGDVVTVEVERGGSPTNKFSCTREFDGSLEIDVTGGTIGGKPCYALDRDGSGTPLWFGSGVDKPYRIEYQNVDKIAGTYSFVVDGPTSSDIGIAPGGSQPYEDTNAIYDLTVTYSYHTTDVGYETAVRVAPGEVPP